MIPRYCLLIIALFFISHRSLAQQQSAPPAPQPSEKEKKEEQKKRPERTLGVLPRLGVTNRKDAPPLTPKKKFQLFYKTAFDPAQFIVVGLQAGITQADNSFPEYGQGASGYGKRYGAAFADQVSSGFFTNFAYPTLLKEDPRYFRLGEGSFKHRFSYALAQEFIAHKDGGGRSFNWSNSLGAVSSGSISNAYYPAADRGFALTMSRAGISLLYGSLGGLGSEFWPDISRKLHHRRESQLAPRQQTQK